MILFVLSSSDSDSESEPEMKPVEPKPKKKKRRSKKQRDKDNDKKLTEKQEKKLVEDTRIKALSVGQSSGVTGHSR